MRCSSLLRRSRRLGSAFILLAGLTPALAAPPKYEITPILGSRSGGELRDKENGTGYEFLDDPSTGLLFSISLDDVSFIEFLISRQDALLTPRNPFVSSPELEFAITYIQVGGLYQWEKGWANPFITGGLGVSFLDPEMTFDTETFFGFYLGTGVKADLNQRLGLRLDLRVYGTPIDGDGPLFCDVTCFIGNRKGTVFFQGEVTGGLILRF